MADFFPIAGVFCQINAMTTPTNESQRIESLDVLRGFALLGILMLNILGFGMISSAYFNPQAGDGAAAYINLFTWASVDILFEGAMRGLFSILFGAGVALFTDAARGKTAGLHYKRNFWLLVFGLLDAFVLLWVGDILIVYALAGFLLYPARNASPRALLTTAGIMLFLLSGMYMVMHFGLSQTFGAAQELASNADASEEVRSMANAWHEFESGMRQSEESAAAELAERQGSYSSAAAWTAEQMAETLLFVVPAILFWDALVMMIIGMALYKMRILDASRSTRFYVNLTVFGFFIGLIINGYEVWQASSNQFHPLSTFSYVQWSYHFGRLGMALGYLGLVMLACKLGWWAALRARLAAVGRMALTNYLMHSAIALVLFTGAGFALVGTLERWQLYVVVFAIWLVQLWLSPWWLARNRFGPVELLWRKLTYGFNFARTNS